MAAPDETKELTGGCLCGAVRFATRAPDGGVVNCHCSQCRRFHGNFGAYATVPRTSLRLTDERSLSWYRSSERARRGFCGVCGSSLFWDGVGRDDIDIAAGAFDQPTGLETTGHINVADKPDYYEITDGLARRNGA